MFTRFNKGVKPRISVDIPDLWDRTTDTTKLRHQKHILRVFSCPESQFIYRRTRMCPGYNNILPWFITITFCQHSDMSFSKHCSPYYYSNHWQSGPGTPHLHSWVDCPKNRTIWSIYASQFVLHNKILHRKKNKLHTYASRRTPKPIAILFLCITRSFLRFTTHS